MLVGKPDGSIRFCVDYRKVNEVSRFDAYPMPRVDELLDRLGTAQFFRHWIFQNWTVCTNSVLLRSDYSGLQPRFNASWTECCVPMQRLLRPIWMT